MFNSKIKFSLVYFDKESTLAIVNSSDVRGKKRVQVKWEGSMYPAILIKQPSKYDVQVLY